MGMRVRRVVMKNFRGVRAGRVLFDAHALLVGASGVGKSTLCEALELVLGPERMARRQVIDEYDFYAARYQEADGGLPEVRIEVVLTDLASEAQRRFRSHLRLWSAKDGDFVSPAAMPSSSADATTAIKTDVPENRQDGVGEWCLPVVFVGRFNPAEDDFEGGTFFAHPQQVADDLGGELAGLGAGLKPFTREDKRLCGFLYLRAGRTGGRALTFQRGSLLDTIARLESESAGHLWEQTLVGLRNVVLAGASGPFAKMQAEVRTRVERFLRLTSNPNAVDVQVSDLTRDHVREVLRLFLATRPGEYGVPFNRLSTGALNLLVFALLTYIAELKGDDSVIFAMEEPEIALPPHSQRRLIDFVVGRMGQVILTSHSPYVIERFDPDRVVVLARDDTGALTSTPVVLPEGFKLRKYLDNRRQFAEAVLARAVLVVEGATEAVLFRVTADVLDRDPAVVGYEHPDLVGLSFFDAGNDVSVPLYAPVFAAMGKPVFGIHDTPDRPLNADQQAKATQFSRYLVIAHKGVEKLLVAETPIEVQQRFAEAVKSRSDYPADAARTTPLPTTPSDKQVREHVYALLKARKGGNDGYAALLISECRNRSELPTSLSDFLITINTDLCPPTSSPVEPAELTGSGQPTEASQ